VDETKISQEPLFERLFEMAGDAVILHDAQGKLLRVNQRACESLGYSCDELVSMHVADIEKNYVSGRVEHLFQVMQERPGELLSASGVHMRKDGSEFPVDVVARLFDLQGKDVILAVVRDVTERHALEATVDAQLRMLKAQVVEMEKLAALGSLMAGIGHEIRVPLAAIRANNDTMKRSIERAGRDVGDPGKVERLLGIMEAMTETNHAAIGRLVGLAAALKRVARKDKSEPTPTDLHDGIESTLTLLNHEMKGRIEVVKELQAGLPEVTCHAGEISQVITNLLVNAAQAMGSGTLWLRTRTTDDGASVVVEVEDQGPGIDEQTLARIFDPGFTTKEEGVGTGLGLAISSEIMRAHGGRIEVDSELGRGSTFRLLIPVEHDVVNPIVLDAPPSLSELG
jgi:PAS domain S-box-containing protein